MTDIIIETDDGRYFHARDFAAGTDATFLAVAVKRVRGGFADKTNARETLIRRACCRVLAKSAA